MSSIIIDGLELKRSISDKTKSGWVNVSMSNSHSEDKGNGVFIAVLPSKFIPEHLNPWPGSNRGLHIGSYYDPREAAYVAAKAKANIGWALKNVASRVLDMIFPDALYDIDRGISDEEFHKHFADKAARKAARKALKLENRKGKVIDAVKAVKFVEVEMYGEMVTLEAGDMLAIKCVARDLKRGFKRIADAPDSYFNS